MPSGVPQSFRFGRFELDAISVTLRRDGERRRLQPQPLNLLVLLVRRAGTLVTYDDIRAELWGQDTFVEFDQAVHYAIRQIREALRDSADQPLYIETVPRRGYRFIAPVEPVIPAEATAVATATAPSPAAAPAMGTNVLLQKALWANIAELRASEIQRQRTRSILLSLGLIVLLGLIGVGAYVYFAR
jgi:DNA-binding winged helix-turn-helix (wHTH) protein